MEGGLLVQVFKSCKLEERMRDAEATTGHSRQEQPTYTLILVSSLLMGREEMSGATRLSGDGVAASPFTTTSEAVLLSRTGLGYSKSSHSAQASRQQ